MIKIIGVISRGGLPITFRSLIELKSKELLAGLVESLKAISKVLIGESKYRAVDYGKDKLLMLDTDNGYTIIALVMRGEEFVRRLLEVIASDVEREVEPFGGLVTDALQKKFDEIIDRYIGGVEILNEVSVEQIIKKLWGTIMDSLSKSKLSEHLSLIRRKIEKEERYDLNFWIQMKRKVKGNIDDALNFARHGLFDIACAIASKEKSTMGRLLALKTGMLAMEMINQVSPSPKELDYIYRELEERDAGAKLMKGAYRLKIGEISGGMYRDVFGECLSEINLTDDLDGEIYALLLVDTTIVGYPQHAERLLEYLEGRMVVPYLILKLVLEYNRLFEKLYSIASYDEIKPEILDLKHRMASSRKEIEDILDIKIPVRDLGKVHTLYKFLSPCFAHVVNLVLYVFALDILLSSPVPPLDERKIIASEILDLYFRDLRRIISQGYPVWVTVFADYLQSLASSIHTLYDLASAKERKKLISRIHDLVKDVLDVLACNYEKFRMEMSVLTTLSSAINFLMYKQRKYIEEALLLSAIIIDAISIEELERIRDTEPYNYVSIMGNILDTIVFISPLVLPPDKVAEIMHIYVDVITKIAKWMISQGKVNRDYIISTANVAREIIDVLSDDKLEEIINFLLKLVRIAIPDPKKQEYEFAVVAEDLIDLMIESSKRPKLRKYRDIAIKFLEYSKAIFEKYGFEEKAKQIQQYIMNVLKTPTKSD